MRQIQNLTSTPGCRNASTSGFSTRKGRCAHGFRNLPHTSDGRFRECGKNQDRPTRPRFCASATCGFVAKNQVVLGGFRFFPALPELKPQTEGSSNSGGIRDNIQLSRKRQRAVAGKPNNDPPLSSPHVEPAARILPSRRWTINSSS